MLDSTVVRATSTPPALKGAGRTGDPVSGARAGLACQRSTLGTSDPSPSLGLRPLTCVEIVKRLIGLQARSVVTPYQLYRRLIQPTAGGPEFIEIGLGEGGFGLVGSSCQGLPKGRRVWRATSKSFS